MKKHLLKSFIAIIFLFNSGLDLRAQCTATTIPYFEDFSGLWANDQIPLCWAASALGTGCKTYSAQGYAGFIDVSSGPHYFYSRAITLNAGVTYSASVWKKSSLQNSTNGFLGIMIGSSQTSSGLTVIASPAPVTGTMYTSTSNTFNVSNSGTYYIAIAGAYMGSGTGEYLYWDDLSVIVPCPYIGNTPTVTISSSSPTICTGKTSTLSAIGANTYTWSTGTQGSSLMVTPQVQTSYFVTGTNTLSMCSATAAPNIQIYESPIVYNGGSEICIGTSTVLQLIAFSSTGPLTFTWNTGATTATISVAPNLNTVYTVTSSVKFCTSLAFYSVTVNALPLITLNPLSHTICPGSPITVYAGGAQTYIWSNEPSQTGFSVTLFPANSITYTVSGTDQNGCEAQKEASIIVSECTGINEHMSEWQGKLFPIPCKDQLTISVINDAKQIVILDITGREIIKTEISGANQINVSSLTPGFYSVIVADRILRFVKE